MRWKYELKNGKTLRNAIREERLEDIIPCLRECYRELLDAGIIDEYEYGQYTEDFDMYGDFSDWDDPEDTVDYELDNFYDLCDNVWVWVSI